MKRPISKSTRLVRPSPPRTSFLIPHFAEGYDPRVMKEYSDLLLASNPDKRRT